jgi:hypothetical protein
VEESPATGQPETNDSVDSGLHGKTIDTPDGRAVARGWLAGDETNDLQNIVEGSFTESL